jgi:hypothetical protein
LLVAALNPEAIAVFGLYIAKQSADMQIGDLPSSIGSHHAVESGNKFGSAGLYCSRFGE